MIYSTNFLRLLSPLRGLRYTPITAISGAQISHYKNDGAAHINRFIPLQSSYSKHLHTSSRIQQQNASSFNTWLSNNKDGNTDGNNSSNNADRTGAGRAFLALSALGSIAVALAYWDKNYRITYNAASPDPISEEELLKQYGVHRPELPMYSSDDVAKHASVEDRVWLSFNSGVYDITDFVSKHPGGDKILWGAGGAVEPFWSLYAVHKTPQVLAMLEQYRIGNLRPDDVQLPSKGGDPYSGEPRRHPALKPSCMKPFNAEPPLELLVEHLVTPNELFYVRNHLPVPLVDVAKYELEVTGVGVKEAVLSLEDLKRFPKYTITVAVQCAGNRRGEMVKIKPVKGLNWGAAAISNATWTGARLRDVLKAQGFNEDTTTAKHVQFEGLDLDPTSHPYGASIPMHKACDPHGDVLLAYEMNGAPIPRDHGYPVRVIVPGVVGARNVKWLGRIVVSEDESLSHWQQKDYKGFSPNIDWDTVDFSKSPAIQEVPVVSAICSPADGEAVVVDDGKVTVRGYAYSGGGRKIVRVDISSDGGTTWQEVDSMSSDPATHPYAWGWTLWTAKVAVPAGVTKTQIVVKAVDSTYNNQPENFENIWNLRGVLGNAYHRVNVQLK